MKPTGCKRQTQWAGLLFPLLLAGCSPHPGTGTWLPVSETDATFTKLMVQYDGKADFYAEDQDNAVRRCFWVGVSEQSITLNCVQSADTDIKESYQLNVTANRQAELTQGDSVVGRYYWQQPKQ